MSGDELWMVDHYVMTLKDKLDGKSAREFDVVQMPPELVTEASKAVENNDSE